MSFRFCGFEENTTVREIQEKFMEKEKCDEIVDKYRVPSTSRVTGPFDAVWALILGFGLTSTTSETVCQKNYVRISCNGNDTTWYQAVKNWISKDKSFRESLSSQIKPESTLRDLYYLIDGMTNLSDNKKEDLLKTLDANANGISSISHDDKQSKSDKNIMQYVRDEIKRNKQVIFTGAPGTGKTWAVRKYVEEITDRDETRYRFVQFHSSYDYTDFVEGLRPVPDGNGGNMFVRMDGTFKSFCRNIVEANLKRLEQYDSSIASIEDYFEYMKTADDKQKAEIYDKLEETPYFFIIDEINRADLSRVFGELMFGLEESYREVHNRFDTQYKNLPTYYMVNETAAKPIENDCFKKGFFVPCNLRIIGTMNDIDRSVESFDFALRRRFVWIDVKSNDVMFESLKSMRDVNNNMELEDKLLKNVANQIKDMNQTISNAGYGLTEAFHIGPAYFKELVKVPKDSMDDKLREIYENRIAPILREYTRGRKIDVETNLIEPSRKALLGEKNGQ